MTRASRQIVREFFAALPTGELSDELLPPDMAAWTTTSGPSQKASYQAGVKFLRSLFPQGLAYTVASLTAEDDRVAAEVSSHGVLINGEVFQNTYVFVFRIRDGRIAAIAEHFDPKPVDEKLMPLMRGAMPPPAS